MPPSSASSEISASEISPGSISPGEICPSEISPGEISSRPRGCACGWTSEFSLCGWPCGRVDSRLSSRRVRRQGGLRSATLRQHARAAPALGTVPR